MRLCCSLLTLPLLLRREAYQMMRSSGERAKTNRQIKKPTDNANKVNEPNNQKRCLQLQSLHVQRHTVEPVQIERMMLNHCMSSNMQFNLCVMLYHCMISSMQLRHRCLLYSHGLNELIAAVSYCSIHLFATSHHNLVL